MKEQTIRTVRFDTFNGELIPRFGPLGNSSFIKQLLLDIEQKSNKEFVHPDNPEIILSGDEMYKYFYNESFPSLDTMNERGWILDSFAIIYDDNKLQMQVAIFSRAL